MVCKYTSDAVSMFFNSPSETRVEVQLRKHGWHVNNVKKKSFFFNSALPKLSSINYKFHEMLCVKKRLLCSDQPEKHSKL